MNLKNNIQQGLIDTKKNKSMYLTNMEQVINAHYYFFYFKLFWD